MTPRYQYGRRVPAAILPPAPFEIPAAVADETAPNARTIRRAIKRKGKAIAHVVDLIRRETLEARA